MSILNRNRPQPAEPPTPPDPAATAAPGDRLPPMRTPQELALQYWAALAPTEATAGAYARIALNDASETAPRRTAAVNVQQLARLMYQAAAPWLFDPRADSRLRWAVKEAVKLGFNVLDTQIQRNRWPIPRPPLRTQQGHDFLADSLAYMLSMGAAWAGSMEYAVSYRPDPADAAGVLVERLALRDPSVTHEDADVTHEDADQEAATE